MSFRSASWIPRNDHHPPIVSSGTHEHPEYGAAIKAQLDRLSAQTDTTNSLLTQLELSVRTNTASIQELKGIVSTNTASIQELNGIVSTNTASIKWNMDQVNNNARIATSNARIATSNSEIANSEQQELQRQSSRILALERKAAAEF